MKISIVIPVYNVEQYIEDCLKSVASQTYKGEIECIIVNDSTPDNSCSVIENFIKEYKGTIEFKLLHHTVNRGLSAARNTGIDAATGDYIYFIDSDDEITPNAIELLAAPLEQHKYDFIIGDYATIGTDIPYPPLLLKQGAITSSKEISVSFFKEQWYMMAWNKLCNVDFLRREKLYFKEGLINEDNLWSFQLACVAQSMFVEKNKTYRYKVRESSITGQLQFVKKALAFATITQEAYQWSKDRNILFEEGVINQILFYRNIALKNVFTEHSYIKRMKLYLRCCKKIRIDALKFYRAGLFSKDAMRKEYFNHLPGIFGFWNIYKYRNYYKHII